MFQNEQAREGSLNRLALQASGNMFQNGIGYGIRLFTEKLGVVADIQPLMFERVTGEKLLWLREPVSLVVMPWH